MAESMIEKVARALEETDVAMVASRNAEVPVEIVAAAAERLRGDYFAMARAAIEALRELNDAMVDASCDIVVGYDDFALGDGNIHLGIPGYPQKAQEVWSTMIDAALSEQVAG